MAQDKAILKGKAKVGIFSKLMQMMLYKSHVCPKCGAYVVTFLTGINGICPKHGNIIYVSMMETDVRTFREYLAEENQQ